MSGSAVRSITQFVDLDDTPSSFAGEGTKHVRVNSGEDALEFVAVVGALDDLSDVVLASPTADDLLAYSGANWAEVSIASLNILVAGDVDDTPINGATTVPVSSNWAYDHASALVDQHALQDLSDTDLATPSSGMFVYWNGSTAWEAKLLAADDVPDHDDLNNVTANEHIDWTAAGNTDLVTTGTSFFGGADAADVPITGKANASQSADLFRLTDSGDDIAFRVDKFGVPSPKFAYLGFTLNTTIAVNTLTWLYFGNAQSLVKRGWPLGQAGSLISIAMSTQIKDLDDVNDATVEVYVYVYTGNGSLSQTWQMDTVVDAAVIDNTRVYGSSEQDRDYKPFAADDLLCVKMQVSCAGTATIQYPGVTVGVLLNDGTEITTIV